MATGDLAGHELHEMTENDRTLERRRSQETDPVRISDRIIDLFSAGL